MPRRPAQELRYLKHFERSVLLEPFGELHLVLTYSHRLPYRVDGWGPNLLDPRLLFSHPLPCTQHILFTHLRWGHPRARVHRVVVARDELIQHVDVAMCFLPREPLVQFIFKVLLKRFKMVHFTSGFLHTLIPIPSVSNTLRNLAFINSLPLSVRTTNGLLPLVLARMDRKAETTAVAALERIGIFGEGFDRVKEVLVPTVVRGQRAHDRQFQFSQVAHIIHGVAIPGKPLPCRCVHSVRVLSQQPISDLARGIAPLQCSGVEFPPR